jgi:energy-coupling factor transporter ATP-binding protein EcfA2
VVLRVIPNGVPTVEELGLPAEVNRIADLKNGIVLVTGPTGSGKSTTLAAIIHKINHDHAYHIVTIEDPIEYLHPHVQEHRQPARGGLDTSTFALALRAALRQAPKVILIGEMRDVETIETAMEAAETGHLVLSTLHTIDAAKTVERILGVFPKEQEQFIRRASPPASATSSRSGWCRRSAAAASPRSRSSSRPSARAITSSRARARGAACRTPSRMATSRGCILRRRAREAGAGAADPLRGRPPARHQRDQPAPRARRLKDPGATRTAAAPAMAE